MESANDLFDSRTRRDGGIFEKGQLGCSFEASLRIHRRLDLAPALVKRSVAGSGRAEKSQVAQMIRVVLGLPAPPPTDAADALALAVTYLQRIRYDGISPR